MLRRRCPTAKLHFEKIIDHDHQDAIRDAQQLQKLCEEGELTPALKGVIEITGVEAEHTRPTHVKRVARCEKLLVKDRVNHRRVLRLEGRIAYLVPHEPK